MLLILSCPPRSQALNFTFLWLIYYTLLPIVGVVSTALPRDLGEVVVHLVEKGGFTCIG